MGLIRATSSATSSAFADQWKDYYYADALNSDTIVVKGYKRISGRSSNVHGNQNIISHGSVFAVADGQCLIIVEQGKILEICAEPGEYIFDSEAEPSIFAGKLDRNSISSFFHNIGKRIGFGGDAPMDQRVYYFNTKEFPGNPYGTPAPVPFRVVDKNIGLDVDVSIRCFGEYSYRISNPLLFYRNVCGNVEDRYLRSQIDEQLKSELLTSLQPAFAAISEMGIRYSSLPMHTVDIVDSLNNVLSEKWKNTRGIEVVGIGISSLKASEKDEESIKEIQRNAVFRDPAMAAAQLVKSQSIAMEEAARNQNAGPVMAFMGLNMAKQAGGINAQDLFQMGMNSNNAQAQYDVNQWQCKCGSIVSGKYCSSCGSQCPNDADSYWICVCGSKNDGMFCPNCGKRKPNNTPRTCLKCGWKNNNNEYVRFCPNCGNMINELEK